ncbi:hypothetical protein [Prochlorococcus marinus]|uniref:hypothetical protein n=1 Tax=Prochlorococcus marinus TaxID=1219 RepID=UPI0022B59A19|nr:hypothetical protein [Prochlorococcus marinus]
MRVHPIPPVSEPFQYRAIGLVRGVYVPESSDSFSRGKIIDDKGEEIEAVVLGRVLGLIKRHLTVEQPHLWVVYPRSRDFDHLHLQISGIWEPSTLGAEDVRNESEKTQKSILKSNIDKVDEGDNYFSIRGELIYTKPEKNELVLKIRQKPKKNRKKTFPFKLSLKGEMPMIYLRNFVSLDVRRSGQNLFVEDNEILGPIDLRSKRK